MIKKLYNFGKYIPETYFQDNPLNLNLEFGNNGDKKIVFLNFVEKDSNFEYHKLSIEDYDCSKNLKYYLFKNAKGNSVSPFPTIFYEKSSIKDNKLDFNSKAGSKFIRILQENKIFNKDLLKIVEILQLSNIDDELNIDENFILSLKINEEYVGESHYFKSNIEASKNEIFKRFYNKYDTESRAYDKKCYICQNKKEVWGFVDLNDFKFYSSNEDSVIAGGFKKENSWKNYPICPNCSEKLFKYKNVLEKFMSFKFYGFTYFLIPEIVFDNDKNIEINDLITNEKIGLLNLRKSTENLEIDEEILEKLKDTTNFLNYNLFFYEKNNSEFKIIMSIDDVFPSRFSQIYKTKNSVSNSEIFEDLKGIYEKDKIENLKFDFRIIKHFFSNSKTEGNFSKFFLYIIKSIFVGLKIEYDVIIKRIMNKIRNTFINNYSIEYDVLKAILMIRFITVLNLWNKNDFSNGKEINMSNDFNIFFQEHNDFFNSNTKKAIFLEGVLCQFLLDIQYAERKATPFKSRLNSLKLDELIIKRLLPEIINKLEEYESNYYKELESVISEYLLDSKFNMSNDEVSFYFVMGMSLAKKFKKNS